MLYGDLFARGSKSVIKCTSSTQNAVADQNFQNKTAAKSALACKACSGKTRSLQITLVAALKMTQTLYRHQPKRSKDRRIVENYSPPHGQLFLPAAFESTGNITSLHCDIMSLISQLVWPIIAVHEKHGLTEAQAHELVQVRMAYGFEWCLGSNGVWVRMESI